MRKIICFGDSNTFGFNPQNGSRYDSNTRWTAILGKFLDNRFQVIEEGCNNRTAFFLNPEGVLQSGQKYLPKCLEKYKNFEIFILALGTNDLQKFFEITEDIVKNGLKDIICFIKKSNPNVRIIIIPPIILSENILKGPFLCQFDENSIKSSCWIQKIYKLIAKEENCEFLDLNKFVTPSILDGLHFDKESHKIIAEKIANHIFGERFKKGNEIESVGSY